MLLDARICAHLHRARLEKTSPWQSMARAPQHQSQREKEEVRMKNALHASLCRAMAAMLSNLCAAEGEMRQSASAAAAANTAAADDSAKKTTPGCTTGRANLWFKGARMTRLPKPSHFNC